VDNIDWAGGKSECRFILDAVDDTREERARKGGKRLARRHAESGQI